MSSDLGVLRTEFTASQVKIVLNFIIAGFLILFGGFFAAVDLTSALGLAGGFAVAMGAGFVWITYRRNIGQSLSLYEQGVVLAKNRQFRFDQIDAVIIKAGRMGDPGEQPNYIIHSYDFFQGDKKLFSVGAIYTHWKELGGLIENEVTRRLLVRLMDEIRSGKELVFNDLKSAGFGRALTWKVSLQGLIENNRAPIPWSQMQAISSDANDPGVARVFLKNGKPGPGFVIYGSKNAQALLGLMKLLFNRK